MPAVTGRIRNCCDQCANSKIRCGSQRPICINCQRRDRSCTYSYVRQSGRPRRHSKPTQDDGAVNNKEPHPATAGEYERPVEACHSSAPLTIATPSSSPVLALATPSKRSCDHHQLQEIHDEETAYHTEGAPEANLALESTAVDFLDSLSVPPMQHSLSADYSILTPHDTDQPMPFDDAVLSQLHGGCFASVEQSLAMMDQNAQSPLSQPPPPPTYSSSQLEQGLQDILDYSRVRSIVDGMINSPLDDRYLACATELQSQCFHGATAYGGRIDDGQQCQCPSTLNKLYLLVADPKLSTCNKLPPLDLILFLEQTLQNTFERMKHCTTCGSSSMSSVNGVTLCIAANWVTSSIQVALESEIDLFTKRNHSLRSPWGGGYLECHAVNEGAEKGQPYGKSTAAEVVLAPSLDSRNSLKIGIWSASSEAWALCVSTLLTERIKRVQQMLTTVIRHNTKATEMVNDTVIAKAEREMAKNICTKADTLLGMVKTWLTERRL